MIDPTDEMRRAYEKAAADEWGWIAARSSAAGLAAVLALIERDYDVRCGAPYTGARWAGGFRCDRKVGHEGEHGHVDGDHAVSWS